MNQVTLKSETMASDANNLAQELWAAGLGHFGSARASKLALAASLGWPELLEYLQKNLQGMGI